MEIGSAAPKRPEAKPLWEANPEARKPKEETPTDTKSLGDSLNGMAGVETRKNYYQENKKLDKEAFLKMFMEQLKYQDPTKPVDNEKVAQQMAMFSQLEQQVLTNKNLEKMIAGQNNTHLMALNLMGKEITVDKATLQHQKDEANDFSFKLPKEATKLKVNIVTDAGEVVDTIDVGPHAEGNVETKWLGSRSDGRPADTGRYFYAIEASDEKGSPINVESKLVGKVTGVSTADGKTMVHVGNQKVDLMEVGMVKEATPEPAKPLNPGTTDKNSVGTKSESTVPSNSVASKPSVPQEVSIGNDVANALRGNAAAAPQEGKPRVENAGDMMNPIMPVFTR